MHFSDNRAQTLSQCTWLSDANLFSWLVNHIKPYGRSICDVGAGNGDFAISLYPEFERIYCIEPSPYLVQHLRVRVATSFPNISIYQCGVEAIPLQDNSVDISVSKSSLHHFPDQNLGIREMMKVCSKAIAIVEVITPDDLCLDYIRHLVLRKESGRSGMSIFSESDLIGMLGRHCSEVRTLHYDQYIDIKTWLDAGDLDCTENVELYDFVLKQIGHVRDRMQIHFRSGRLVQLRRMCLAIGLK